MCGIKDLPVNMYKPDKTRTLHCYTGMHKLLSETWVQVALFPGSCAWVGRKEPGTHCLCMLSFPRIYGNLEVTVKSAPLH